MKQLNVESILQAAVEKDASDVHFVADKSPVFRILGELTTLDIPVISADALEKMILGLLNETQKERFKREKELDFSYSALEKYQCRFNVHFAQGRVAATARLTPKNIESILRFKFPEIMKRLAQKRSGLVIISGTAGSGKSTTLTYMVDLINKEKKYKIITIEDPIEYVHQSQKSLIVQREVGTDTQTFSNALKYALRQDPDVVVIGEMRDYESVSMALTTAETGHLVITTVHAPDVIETINRIIDVYPIGHRDQICAQLAGNLLGIIAQHLVPCKDQNERVLATEVLISTISIRNLLRRQAFVELRAQIDSEEDPDVYTLERSLSRLVKDGLISVETAESYAKHPTLLDFSENTDFRKTVIVKKKEEPKGELEKAQKEKILIIDEKQSDVDDMTAVLKAQGYEDITSSPDGKTGLAQVQTLNPSIVIIDGSIYDYKFDSLTICKTIKTMPNFKGKIIMITSSLKKDDAQEAKKAGADGFVIKTKAYELLLKSIDSLKKQ